MREKTENTEQRKREDREPETEIKRSGWSRSDKAKWHIALH